MTRSRHIPRRRLALEREAGFTVIEALVAAVVLIAGMLATFGVLQAATRNTERAKSTQVALDRGQQELEQLRSLTSAQLALTATPPHSTDTSNPDYRVSGAQFAANRGQPNGSSPVAPSGYADMVVNGGSTFGGGFTAGGTVNPGPTSFTSGSVKGTIYRYIIWRNDPNCPSTKCNGSQDYKQIIVAVKLDTGVGARGYVEVQSQFIDPNDSTITEPSPGSNGVVTAQQLYFSDTPCDPNASGQGSNTQRQDITGDHLLHNTLGTCQSGPQTGTTPGAPDTLLYGAPPDPSPDDPNDPPLYDYSHDSYLNPASDVTDKGVQIRREDSAGCTYNPGSTANPESQVHRWVTDPMPSPFVMTGTATIEFYTRTLADAAQTGRLCIYLFTRSQAGAVATDVRLVSTGGGNCSLNQPYWCWQPSGNGNWPRFNWAPNGKVRASVSFSGLTIPVGQRFGVAMSLDRANTPSDALSFAYDHPNYPARVEIDTTTPLEIG